MAKKIYYSCAVDYENNCVVFDMRALDGGHVIGIGNAFLAIRRSVKMPWRTIAKCYCLRNANDAWRVAHRQTVQHKDVEEWLGKHIVYDRVNKTARFYFVGHVPGGAIEPIYTNWNVVWSESSAPRQAVTGMECTPFSSVVISDELNRSMVLNIRTGNGILIGFNESLLAGVDNVYQCFGRSYDLQNMIRKLRYLPASSGEHALTLVLSDQKNPLKTKSVTVNLTATASPQSSIPTITATKKSFSGEEIGERIATTGSEIEVSDADNKLLKMTVSTKGCSVDNFGSYIGVINNNQMREFVGLSSHLTNELKNIIVTPLSSLSYIEIRISDDEQHHASLMLVFSVSGDEDQPTETEQKKLPLSLTFADSIDGQSNKNASYTSFVVTPIEPTESVNLTITAEGCRVEVKDKQGTMYAASKSAGPLSIDGTVADLANLLSIVSVNPTTTSNGTITFVFTTSDNQKIEHTTTVVVA